MKTQFVSIRWVLILFKIYTQQGYKLRRYALIIHIKYRDGPTRPRSRRVVGDKKIEEFLETSRYGLQTSYECDQR